MCWKECERKLLFLCLIQWLGMEKNVGGYPVRKQRFESFDINQLEAYFLICSRIHEQSI